MRQSGARPPEPPLKLGMPLVEAEKDKPKDER